MLSFRAFWVAISYRLAACFTQMGIGIKMLKQLKYTVSRKYKIRYDTMQKYLTCAQKLTDSQLRGWDHQCLFMYHVAAACM